MNKPGNDPIMIDKKTILNKIYLKIWSLRQLIIFLTPLTKYVHEECNSFLTKSGWRIVCDCCESTLYENFFWKRWNCERGLLIIRESGLLIILKIYILAWETIELVKKYITKSNNRTKFIEKLNYKALSSSKWIK